MKALVYARVSTEDQVRYGYSLRAQEEACRKKAVDSGAVEVLTFRDEGITGSVLERPGLQAALQACRDADCRVFIVYDPDRLSRKLAHQLMLVDTIEKNGCRLEFVNFEWQDTPEGRLFYSMRGAVAEYEKEKFRARSKFGKLAKARRGLLTHDPGIFGYVYRAEKSSLEINSEEAVVYHRMAEMALQGKTPGEIAQILNREEVPGPGGGKWYRTTVRRILKNPSYTGTLYLNRYSAGGIKSLRAAGKKAAYGVRPREEWIPVNVPLLLPPEKWNLLQQIITGRRSGKKANTYLLSGLLFCGKCGSSMHGSSTSKKSGKVYRYYICSRKYSRADRKNKQGCSMKAVNALSAEDAVWSNISCWLCFPVKDVETGRFNFQGPKEGELLQKQLSGLDREKERVFKAFREGIIEIEEFRDELERIKRRQKRLEKRFREWSEETEVLEDVNGPGTLPVQVSNHLHLLKEEERCRVLNLLVKRITVYPGADIIIEAAVDKKLLARR